MLGTILFWNEDRQFGFAVADDSGEEFYLGASRFIRPAGQSVRLPLVNLEGKHISFEREQKCDDAWTRRLNDGKARDDGIDFRNPRPPRRHREKPVAINVIVVEEKLCRDPA